MYAFVDRPVGSLDQGGRFLLWAMRAWAQSIARRQCPGVSMAAGFAGMGLLRALPDFHLMTATLNRQALGPVSMAPLCAKRIAEDEALLLTLWQDVADGQQMRVRETLSLVAAGDSVGTIVAAMARVTAQFADVGLTLGEGADAAREPNA